MQTVLSTGNFTEREIRTAALRPNVWYLTFIYFVTSLIRPQKVLQKNPYTLLLLDVYTYINKCVEKLMVKQPDVRFQANLSLLRLLISTLVGRNWLEAPIGSH